MRFDQFCLLTIVAGNGVEASFHDPGSIDPDRGSGTTAGRRGSMAGSRSCSLSRCSLQACRRRCSVRPRRRRQELRVTGLLAHEEEFDDAEPRGGEQELDLCAGDWERWRLGVGSTGEEDEMLLLRSLRVNHNLMCYRVCGLVAYWASTHLWAQYFQPLYFTISGKKYSRRLVLPKQKAVSLPPISSNRGHRPIIKWIPTHVPNCRTGDVYPLSNLIPWDGDPRPSTPFLDPNDPDFWQLCFWHRILELEQTMKPKFTPT
jgi:hypothetical protein